jgi:Ca-activated chloride channel family protein
MEGMADRGNGQYAYVDSLLEARKVLVKELGGTLATIAKDVKLQVEFNPARVAAYRLIGYENRLLRKEDFEDDAKDAGEMGSGHAVTALYEIVPTGVEPDVEIRRTGPLRYQANAGSSGSDTPRRPQSAATAAGDELAFVNIRYKAPDGDTSRLMNHPVVDLPGRPSADFGFAAAVAEFGMLLRGSKHAGQASLDEVIALARGSLGRDEEGYRQDFIRLAEAARPLLQKPVEVASIERE